MTTKYLHAIIWNGGVNMDILDLAEWFLQQQPMSHKKLQKMCYYAVAWGYALYNKQMFTDDTFEAWQHGPVNETLYQKYKGNGWNELRPEGRQINPTSEQNELLENIMFTYGDQSGNSLEAHTHHETPWVNARKGLRENERGHNAINTQDMHDYYLSVYDGDEA